MKIGIIGAGASGIIAALTIDNKYNITLIDSNNMIGKKILLTGNGKCNYWNENINPIKYNSYNYDLIKKIINEDNINNTYNTLLDIGLYPKIKDGYYYPLSQSAQSVKTIFEKNINKKKNIELKLNYNVNKIEVINNKFIINNEMEFDKLIIATGGKSYPKTGSNGNLFEELRKLGHEIRPLYPSLTNLIFNSKYNWDGIRTDVKVCLLKNNELIDSEIGEIQLKESSLSGICIFNLSSKVQEFLNNNDRVHISIDFMPNMLDVKTFLEERNDLLNNISLEELLESIFNYKLMYVIFNKSKIDSNRTWNELSDEEKGILVNTIKRFKIEISDTGDFTNAQVTKGGVSLEDTNLSTMESKIVNNLYVIGEALDIDGKCGGFNLANAFITGYLVGKNL